MMTRRTFASVGSVALLAACAQQGSQQTPVAPPAAPPPDPIPPLPAHYGAITDEPYSIPAVPEGVVPQRLWRQEVENPYPDEAEGSLIIDPDAGYLHLIGTDGRAMRYGAGTGAAAFEWSGTARMQFRRDWPRWKVPASMIARRPELEPFSVANGGMAPGPGNPLGARALYLFQDGVDTLYRIHGACEPEHLGKRVSSGCIRLLDHDVIDLDKRVRHGVSVRVLNSVNSTGQPSALATAEM